jgi:hypothetical protein
MIDTRCVNQHNPTVPYSNEMRQWMPPQCLADVSVARLFSSTTARRTGHCIAIARVVDGQPPPRSPRGFRSPAVLSRSQRARPAISILRRAFGVASAGIVGHPSLMRMNGKRGKFTSMRRRCSTRAMCGRAAMSSLTNNCPGSRYLMTYLGLQRPVAAVLRQSVSVRREPGLILVARIGWRKPMIVIDDPGSSAPTGTVMQACPQRRHRRQSPRWTPRHRAAVVQPASLTAPPSTGIWAPLM